MTSAPCEHSGGASKSVPPTLRDAVGAWADALQISASAELLSGSDPEHTARAERVLGLCERLRPLDLWASVVGAEWLDLVTDPAFAAQTIEEILDPSKPVGPAHAQEARGRRGTVWEARDLGILRLVLACQSWVSSWPSRGAPPEPDGFTVVYMYIACRDLSLDPARSYAAWSEITDAIIDADRHPDWKTRCQDPAARALAARYANWKRDAGKRGSACAIASYILERSGCLLSARAVAEVVKKSGHRVGAGVLYPDWDTAVRIYAILNGHPYPGL